MPAFVPAFLLERHLPPNKLNTSISLSFDTAVAREHPINPSGHYRTSVALVYAI